MLKTVQNEEYMDTQEVMALFDASKKRFYSSIKPHLRVYHFDARKTPWYRRQDVLAFKDGKIPRKTRIVLSGITPNWTQHLENSGFRAETSLREAIEAPLPEDAVSLFRFRDERRFLRRGRMSLADGVPICYWDTYYPVELIDDDLLAEIKSGGGSDIPMAIKEKHGLVVECVEEWYSARMATFEEQALLRLVTDDPVLVLQRASYTKDRGKLVFYSHMVLLANWFDIRRDYNTDIWSAA